MLTRILTLLTALLVLGLAMASGLATAEEKTHEGTVVKAGAGKITLIFKGDSSKHKHDVAAKAKITLDGKAAKLEDLTEGAFVRLTMDDDFVVTNIEARSKK